ncbi:MAG: hypothetical protein Q7S34_04525 [bacterium]|nr:hypothetical protein [bacterium]
MKSFAKFMPSKSFRGVLLSLLVVFALIGSAYAISQKESVREKNLGAPVLGITDGAQEQISKLAALKDSDSDELKDWEEVLWKTDPYNPDTDGDNAQDGDEVKGGRDPSVPGPNDKLTSQESLATVEKNAKAAEVLTPTDIVARDLFSKYVAARQGNKELDQNIEQQIADSVLQRQEQITSHPRLYTEGDLLATEDSDSQALRDYGNKMGAIVIKNFRQQEYELDILNSAIQKNDRKRIEDLNPIINNYKNSLEESLKVSVPKKAVGTHLKFMNALSKIITSLEAMKNVFADPITAMVYFGEYPTAVQSLRDAFNDARDLFIRNNITFDSNKESGYYYGNYAEMLNYADKLLQQSQ